MRTRLAKLILIILTFSLIISACGKAESQQAANAQVGTKSDVQATTAEPLANDDAAKSDETNQNKDSAQEAQNEQGETSGPDEKRPNDDNWFMFLTDLLYSVEEPSGDDLINIEADLELIKSVSESDYEIASSIAECWEELFLDPDYELNMHSGGENAPELEDSGIPQGPGHAFVVLGYQLENGEMAEELKSRCNAAAAAAKTFPDSILVCSGGATGYNNPERHTEAGMMKAYLSEECGIDPDRIYTDERAMTTAENAANTFRILRNNNISTYTIVTSSYHLKWGEELYNAVGAIYDQRYDFQAVALSNYCYETAPEYDMFLMDARFTVIQLAEILQLPEDMIYELPQIPGYTPHIATIKWE